MLVIEVSMKKSNKLTVFYVISSVSLFLVLLLGGIYGVYVSVGLNFVRSNSVPNEIAGGNNGLANVSFGGSVNYSPSMVGVIFLSIILNLTRSSPLCSNPIAPCFAIYKLVA